MDWHLNIAWIQVLNGTGIMWMVSSLLNPKTARAEGTEWKILLCFAQVTFSLPDSATVCSDPWPEVDGVREDRGLKWTEEACKEFYRQGLHDNHQQEVQLPLAPTLSVPQPIVPRLEG